MALLAFDDTDSRQGGCTTYLAFHVLLALPELALTGMPRLVRLNPNVPWRTRGNGAVVLPLGFPRGPSVRVGELRGLEILAFPDAAPAPATQEMLDRAWDVLQRQAQPGSSPAAALADDAPPSAGYWQAVRGRVLPEEARELLESSGALHRAAGDGRGLAGCLGALAWPGPASSHEFLAYRHPARWGTPREVKAEPLRALDRSGATFHTIDPLPAGEARNQDEEPTAAMPPAPVGDAGSRRPALPELPKIEPDQGRLVCVPHGPDPVLIGLRGRNAEALLQAATRALPFALGEAVDGWLLWSTNQASGDHVTPVASVLDAPEWGTIAVAAEVDGAPEDRRGGHTFVPLVDGHGARLVAAAFEPTKGLREAVRCLRPGDRVVAVGAWSEGAVHLEKLKVEALAPQRTKAANPVCPSCGRAMKSAGAGQGYRCRDCGTKAPAEAAGWQDAPRTVAVGWHEVPVGARRHLHRPLAWDVEAPA